VTSDTPDGPADEDLGIDDLARRAGTTVRTVRLYQEKGLLPPPERRGRFAAYGARHLTRLQLVLRLASRGYSLAAIADLTAAWDAQQGLAHVLGVEDVLAERVHTEHPARVTLDELLAWFPPDPGEEPLAGLEQALELGLLVPADDGDYLVPSPSFLDAGAELRAAGMSNAVTLALARAVRETTTALAERFVQTFRSELVDPFEAAGEPAERGPALVAAIHRLRPLAVQSVTAAMAQAIDAAVDRALMDVPPATVGGG
jgi:DNA-binding transcriptional MerR regulator